MKTCPQCGASMPDREKFCMRCGKVLVESASANAPKPVARSMPVAPRPQTPSEVQGGMVSPAPQKKKVLVYALIAIAVISAIIIVLMLTGVIKIGTTGTSIISPAVLEEAPKVEVAWDVESDLPTAFYTNKNRRLVRIKLKTDKDAKVKVSVEIPEITEKEIRTLDVAMAEKGHDFKPPFLQDAYGRLSKAQSKFINLKVTTIDDKIIREESIPIRVLSRNDMVWVEKDGTQHYEDIARWVTMNNKEVEELVRVAAEYNEQLCGTHAMVGYLGDETMVVCQLASIFAAMQDAYQVAYIASTESYTTSNAQSIRLPEDVLKDHSGLCIETTVLVAAALENLGLEPAIVIIPGHAWVAVKTYPGSPSYFHLETTMLDAPVVDALETGEMNWMTEGGSAIAIVDIKKARERGIMPFGEASGEREME
ncbi:MAG: hypothetical protein ACD_50C00218G0003 [uncultured bacterium]|nr:MAG: hypothetical protein ACD_50C00218G0003 [uncultured bacterium]